MALDEINNNPHLLPNITLIPITNDTNGLPPAIINTISQINQGVVGIVGSGSAQDTAQIALITGASGVQ